MTLYYEAGFAVNSTASSPLRMAVDVSGFHAVIATGTYAHQTMAACSSAQANVYTAFGVAVKAALDSAASSTFTVTYSTSTHKYTISRATNFTLEWLTADMARLAAALGFVTTTVSGQTSYTGTLTPYYVIVPTEIARSAQLPFIYEPDDIVEEAMSDGGTSYGVAKDTTELWSDWMQMMEVKATCYDTAAVATAPWTWQKFFRHTRGQYPFAVYESALFNAAYKNRAESARFKIAPVISDLDTIYNVPFRTYYLGTV